MLTLYCSKKLQDYLGFKENQIEPNIHTFLNSWNGHLFTINRKKGLIFMNQETCFSFAVYPVVKTDVKSLNELFLKGLLLELEKLDYLTPQLKVQLEKNFQRVYLHKSINNKKIIGLVNHQVIDLEYYYYSYDSLEEWLMFRTLNDVLYKVDGKNFEYPKDLMETKLSQLFTPFQIVD